MIECASKDGFSARYRVQDGANFPVKWQPVQTFVDFIESTFPHDASSSVPLRAFTGDRGLKAWKLKAWKLRARYAARIVPTNDLVQHLLYDRRTGTLSVFHQTAWLKAKFGTLRDRVLPRPPRQLLVETLLSIYNVLFPLSVDKRSLKLARSLVHYPAASARFDPNLLVDDGLVRDLPDHADDFHFVYWAERDALTVALNGLFLAELFGLLGVVVGIAQLVVSYLAWEYPTPLTFDEEEFFGNQHETRATIFLAILPIAFLWSVLFTARAIYKAFVQSMTLILENTAVTFYWLSLLVPVLAILVFSSTVRNGWKPLVLAALASLWWYSYSNFETRTYTYVHFAITVFCLDEAVGIVVTNAIAEYGPALTVAKVFLG
ncbi:hypothetical protein B0T26DRAFT_679412 [Lasiosphaeria miniovina]|uniref:Uncharacterized protein n=1 Tax=Lasiosphaeria miniovina TaxID=1954250 RepID=A0AA40DS89_9PEZI|nr:uncharacterized protein B0T26DRAFT_679412 [Lasiosphaeria miniovina]KAK0710088.1 hypothetical protein B0T26DRAFT_679412 [Lasiosphaeria miniovina]